MAASLSIANFFTSSANYAITDSGTPIDWALFNSGSGASTTLPPGQRMSGGGSTISDIARVNTGNISGFTVYLANASWTGGTPTASGNNTNACYNDTNGGGGTATNFGASFTLPATTAARRVRVYCGTFNGDITLTATLGDGSAGPAVNTSLTDPAGTTGVFGYFDITFEAGSSTTLTLQFMVGGGRSFSDIEIQGIAIFSAGTNVALTGQGATLAQGTLGVNADAVLTGQGAVLALGNFVTASDTGLTGQGATLTQGAMTADTSVALTGQNIAATQGTLGVDAGGNVSMSGQDGNLALGTLGVDVQVALTGQNISAATGTLTPNASTDVALTGQGATISLGTLGQVVANNVSGVAMAIQLGVLTPQYTPAPGAGASPMRRVWTQFQIDHLERLEASRKAKLKKAAEEGLIAEPSPRPKAAKKKPAVAQPRTGTPDFWAQNAAIMRAASVGVMIAERIVLPDQDEDEALLLAALD